MLKGILYYDYYNFVLVLSSSLFGLQHLFVRFVGLHENVQKRNGQMEGVGKDGHKLYNQLLTVLLNVVIFFFPFCSATKEKKVTEPLDPP